MATGKRLVSHGDIESPCVCPTVRTDAFGQGDWQRRKLVPSHRRVVRPARVGLAGACGGLWADPGCPSDICASSSV